MIDHPYQLRRIELKDFKSVDHAAVDLKPLTIVVGANSAGKSTLLQSILAVAQAVRSGTGSSEFPLNGEFIRLGTFDETRNFRSQRPIDTPMELAFELVDANSALPRRREEEPALWDQLKWRAYVVGPTQHGDEVSETSGFPRLTSLEIEVAEIDVDFDDEPNTILTCDISSFDETEPIDDLAIVTRRTPLVRGRGSVVPASGRISDRQNMMTTSVDAVALSGGVPQLLLRRTGQFERFAELWWSTAFEVLGDLVLEERRRVAGEKGGGLPALPNSAALDRAEVDFDDLGLTGATSDDVRARGAETHADALERTLVRRLAQLDDSDRRDLAASIVELGESRFRSELRERFAGADWLDVDVLVEHSGPAGEALWRASFLSRQFFANSVEYLGPLREAPHVLYDPGPSSTHLGIRGEYSAAVLHAQRDSMILMPTPEGPGERVRLRDALDYWLREFELADSARSEDLGRVGIGLNVTPPGADREVDLTAVGVGVSQILPVVLLCLLSEPGSLLILEQPELHLHPKLQQDLADFLLACARSGRQLVIESHSEHLANRLRYRIAEDETDATHGLIQLVFAENDQGVTRYRGPEINPYGGLSDDWPAGFLDVTVHESQELLRQSLAKRKRYEAAVGDD